MTFAMAVINLGDNDDVDEALITMRLVMVMKMINDQRLLIVVMEVDILDE